MCFIFRLIENNVLQEKFHKRVSRTVKFYIDDEVRKQRFQRKIDIVNEIIDSIDEKWDADNTFSDISNDSDEFEALKEIEYTEAGKKSAFINRLKTESIMSDLNELDDNITRGERNYEVKWITFSSLTKLCDHPNATVSRLAKDVKYKLKDIKSEEIGEKYGIEAELKHLTKCKKDVLRSLNIKDTDDQRFSKNVERLYWLLTKDDIDNNYEKLIEKGDEFTMATWYYERIISYVERGAHVPIFFKQSALAFKKQLDKTFGQDVVPPSPLL